MKRKLFPTRWYEVARWWRDRAIDKLLATERGREQYWRELEICCRGDSKISLLKECLHLSGDVIECGVYRGGSLMKIARTLRELAPEKKLFGLDSFQGFPSGSVIDLDVCRGRMKFSVQRKFRFCSDTPTRIRNAFDLYQVNAELVPGYFSQTLPRFQNCTFCFIHLDCDIYASYVECLNALYDRLTAGGIIVFDEYDSKVWPGSVRAIDEFFADKPEKVQQCHDGQHVAYFVRKVEPAALHKAA